MSSINLESRSAAGLAPYMWTNGRGWCKSFLFAPANPAGLAICRIWFFGYLLYRAAGSGLETWALAPADLWQPILLLGWLPGPPRSAELLNGVHLAFVAAIALSLVGLGTRLSTKTAFVLGIFVYGLPNCFGKVSHGLTLVIFGLGFFALARAGDALSLDRLIGRLRGRSRPAPSGEYRWPIALMQLTMVLVFCAAGVAKLRTSGLAWIYSDTLLNYMVRAFYVGQDPATRLGPWLAQFPLLCNVLAFGTIWCEVTAPLALFSKRYRWFVIPSLFAMQVGIDLVMGISFHHYLACYLFWIPWSDLADRTAAMWRRQPALSPPAKLVPSLRRAA
ncbi:MAG: hypothetical protein SFU86_00415 [Pirellulaceae bacterium]|nr:hypothetical protein [Pirellulaceae bacterium]